LKLEAFLRLCRHGYFPSSLRLGDVFAGSYDFGHKLGCALVPRTPSFFDRNQRFAVELIAARCINLESVVSYC